MLKASLSQFMHGEQGAMLTAAKLVETVPWIDAKYYAATQTMDEARHTEVFARYLDAKLGDAYPMSPYLEGQITALLEDSRWDIAYLGMQIVIESLALAAFGDMLRRIQEPLLHQLLRYVLADEAAMLPSACSASRSCTAGSRMPSSRSARSSCSTQPCRPVRARPRPRSGSTWASPSMMSGRSSARQRRRFRCRRGP